MSEREVRTATAHIPKPALLSTTQQQVGFQWQPCSAIHSYSSSRLEKADRNGLPSRIFNHYEGDDGQDESAVPADV